MTVRNWQSALVGAVRVDRVLLLALLTGGILGAVLLWSHATDRVRNFETILTSQVRGRAAAMDVHMRIAVGHLEALRQRAEFFYAEYPAPSDVPASTLMTALLASNPGNLPQRGYHLDRLPPPYLVDQIGNIVSLPPAQVDADPALSRPDEAGWRQEASMAVQLLPLMAVTQKVVPSVRRLFYASLTGMVAVHPWTESSRIDILSHITNFPPFAAASPGADPRGEPVWSLARSADGAVEGITLSLPLNLQGRFAGVFGIEVPVDGVQAALGTINRANSMILLVDADGTIIAGASSVAGVAPPRNMTEIYAPGLPAQADGSVATQSPLDPLIVAAPLRQTPWRVVYVAPRLTSLLPTLTDILVSVAGFIASVLVVLFVARRLMQRALAVRDSAAAAEREARAEAERALADLRAAHDELDFLNREKTRFFSLISHDLRGPFNSMLGMTQELADHAPKMRPEDTADFARSVHEMARKVFDLLENLLQWSRVQMSGTPFAPTVFPMREVVGDAIRDVASAAQAKEIQILDASGDRWVLADRTMILAVLRNLLMNAVKFSHQGGVVHVTSRALGDRLELAVTDKGVGMEPAQLEQALKAGPKASRPGTQGETGTGLGLTLVRDLVLRHGGELKLESNPGRGTIVSFTVPLTTDPAETRRLMARAAD